VIVEEVKMIEDISMLVDDFDKIGKLVLKYSERLKLKEGLNLESINKFKEHLIQLRFVSYAALNPDEVIEKSPTLLNYTVESITNEEIALQLNFSSPMLIS
jgi:hypothetical protein